MLRRLALTLCLLLQCSLAFANQIGGASGISSAGGSSGGGGSVALSKGSVLNINFIFAQEYMFNNMLNTGGGIFPFTGSTPFNSARLDANGWPNTPNDSNTYGAPFSYPGQSGVPGPYIYYGFGTGTVNITSCGGCTWTVVTSASQGCPASGGTSGASYGYSTISNGSWNVTPTGSGNDWCIVLTVSGSSSATWEITKSDPNSTGSYIHGLYFGFAADFANWQSGLIYRTTWKQEVLQSYPHAIRFMNWANAPGAVDSRFEFRNPPPSSPQAGLVTTQTVLSSPPYVAASGVNNITVPAAAGMPVTSTHGEIAAMNLSNKTTGAFGIGNLTITKAATPVVTVGSAADSYTGAIFSGYISNTCGTSGVAGTVLNITAATSPLWAPGNIISPANVFQSNQAIFGSGVTDGTFVASQQSGTAGGVGCYTVNASQLVGTSGSPVAMTGAMHHFVEGDKVVHWGTGTNLDYFPVTISTKTATCGAGNADQTHYCITTYSTAALASITTGSAAELYTLNVGGRGAYPIADIRGLTPVSADGAVGAQLQPTSYVFCFDKVVPAQSDGNGNWVYGAWDACQLFQGGTGVPIEYEVAMINEINAMRPGGAAPIALWHTEPFRALTYNDPDYAVASDWSINAHKIITQGNGAYAALTAGTPIIDEKGDEDWNESPAFYAATYYCIISSLRGGAPPSSINTGCGDNSYYSTLKSIIIAESIRSSAYYNANTKFFLGFAINGLGPTDGGFNQVRYSGDTLVNNDPLNTWYAATHATPMSHFDFGGYAPYISAPNFNDLATTAASWAAASGNVPLQNSIIATWISNNLVNCGTTASGKFCTSYFSGNFENVWIPAMLAIGKCWGNYEGGLDLTINFSGFTTQVQQFVSAMRMSAAWGNAQVAYFNTYNVPGGCYPSIYTWVGPEWGLAFPDTFSTTAGPCTPEGCGNSAAWGVIGTYNTGKFPYIDEDDVRLMMFGVANDNLSYNMVVGW